VHRAENAVGHIGGPGYEEKVAAGHRGDLVLGNAVGVGEVESRESRV
jgi:hypothetical protein